MTPHVTHPRWHALGLVGTMAAWGCVGLPPPNDTQLGVEGTSFDENATTDATTTMANDTSATTTIDGASTGQSTSSDGTTISDDTSPIAMCGNDDAEPGETCDGLDLQGATCESLGYMGTTGLACDNCFYDVWACGSPPGMAPVPSGAFTMGSDSQPDEQPIRQLSTNGFWIDVNEVTTQDYIACVTAGICAMPQTGVGYNYGVAGREYHPVNGVSWFGAQAYSGLN